MAGFYKSGKIKTKSGYLSEVDLIPNIKGYSPIIYKFYNNESQLVDAYKSGEINQMTLTKKSIADTFLSWKNSSVQRKVDYSRLMTLFLNQKVKILTNKNIKDAIGSAFDYQKLSAYGEIAKGPIPPTSWGYDPNLKSNTYDPENASTIVRNEIKATEEAKLNLVTSYNYYDVADEISGELKAIGLNNDLNFSSINQIGSFDMLLAYWKVPTDPDQYFFWHSKQTVENQGGNIVSYNNPKIDNLLEEGRSTIDLDKREAIYFDFQKNIIADPPAIFLFYPYVYTISRR